MHERLNDTLPEGNPDFVVRPVDSSKDSTIQYPTVLQFLEDRHSSTYKDKVTRVS